MALMRSVVLGIQLCSDISDINNIFKVVLYSYELLGPSDFD